MVDAVESGRERAGGRRVWHVALWVLQVVTALWFLMAALGKFSGSPEIVATFHALGFGAWFRYLIGALEVAGAVAMFVPRLTGAAALAFVLLLVGALVVQAFVVGSGVIMPIPLLILSAVIAWGRRDGTVRLWRSAAGRAVA